MDSAVSFSLSVHPYANTEKRGQAEDISPPEMHRTRPFLGTFQTCLSLAYFSVLVCPVTFGSVCPFVCRHRGKFLNSPETCTSCKGLSGHLPHLLIFSVFLLKVCLYSSMRRRGRKTPGKPETHVNVSLH